LHPGDVVWRFYTPNFDPEANIRLWFGGQQLTGFAWFEPPLNVDFDLLPSLEGAEDLSGEMMTWAEERRNAVRKPGGDALPIAYAGLGQGTLNTLALVSDSARVAALTKLGFSPADQGAVRYRLSLDEPIPEPSLPSGMHLRHAADADLDERIELHRDAWSVWGPSSQNVATYRQLRAAPVYDESLDVVLEDAGGRLVSYCICWADAESGVGAFEPVGVRPALAGQGYGRSVIFEGLRRLKARGMHTALVGTATVNKRAMVLYPSCGFELVDREQFYTKKV
jgi:predicted N-acetyltransferase YhbS